MNVIYFLLVRIVVEKIVPNTNIFHQIFYQIYFIKKFIIYISNIFTFKKICDYIHFNLSTKLLLCKIQEKLLGFCLHICLVTYSVIFLYIYCVCYYYFTFFKKLKHRQ